MSTGTTPDDAADFRVRVVAESIRLFAENGYEATSVDQIAAIAGISRRTFFRQFGSKEDVIFADHESLLASVNDALEHSIADPWQAVCDAAMLVFDHFRTTGDLAIRRSRVVAEVPALRDREMVTGYRYQRAFEDFLRARLPREAPERVVTFAGAITATHNYLLRSMLRGDAAATPERLRTELSRIRRGLAEQSQSADGTEGHDGSQTRTKPPTEVTVVSYPAGTSSDEIAARVAEALRDRR